MTIFTISNKHKDVQKECCYIITSVGDTTGGLGFYAPLEKVISSGTLFIFISKSIKTMNITILLLFTFIAYNIGKGRIRITIKNDSITSLPLSNPSNDNRYGTVRNDFEPHETVEVQDRVEADILLEDEHRPNAFRIICRNCGKVDYKKSAKAKFCSDTCRMEYHKNKKGVDNV